MDEQGGMLGRAPTTRAHHSARPEATIGTSHQAPPSATGLLGSDCQAQPVCQRPLGEAGGTGGGAGCGWLAFVSGQSWEGLGGNREHIHTTFSAAAGLAAGMSLLKAKADQGLPLKQRQIELPSSLRTRGGAHTSTSSQRSGRRTAP